MSRSWFGKTAIPETMGFLGSIHRYSMMQYRQYRIMLPPRRLILENWNLEKNAACNANKHGSEKCK